MYINIMFNTPSVMKHKNGIAVTGMFRKKKDYPFALNP